MLWAIELQAPFGGTAGLAAGSAGASKGLQGGAPAGLGRYIARDSLLIANFIANSNYRARAAQGTRAGRQPHLTPTGGRGGSAAAAPPAPCASTGVASTRCPACCCSRAAPSPAVGELGCSLSLDRRPGLSTLFSSMLQVVLRR